MTKTSLLPTVVLLVVLPLVTLLQGCGDDCCSVGSVYPIAGNELDRVFDPELVGTWRDPDGDAFTVRWIAERRAYEFEFKGEAKAETAVKLDADLVVVGSYHFLDLYPPSGGHESWQIGVHMFCKAVQNGDSLALIALNGKWLAQQLDGNLLSVEARRDSDGVILTSKPEKLQEFLSDYGDNEDAFVDSPELHFQRDWGASEVTAETTKPAQEE